MNERIEIGQMAFVDGRSEAIGAIRNVSATAIVIHIENFGDFSVELSAVASVHDGKVILDRGALVQPLLKAADHAHSQ